MSFYDQVAFEEDYYQICHYSSDAIDRKNQESKILNSGDVVISNSVRLAMIVGKNNHGKVATLNFTKVDFNDDILDKRYFVYLFNHFSDVQKQKERELQGNGSILRLSIKSLASICIPYPIRQEQEKIGLAYGRMLLIQKQLEHYSSLIEKLTYGVLEKQLKEK